MAGIATLGTHYLAYQLALRDEATRAHILAESGHGWLGWAWPAVIVAAVAVLAGALRSARDRNSRELDAACVYLVSAVSFLGVEIVERWLHLGSLNAVAENLATWRNGVPVLLGLLLLTVVSPLMVRSEHAIREKIASAFRDTEQLAVTKELHWTPQNTPLLEQALLSSISLRGPPTGWRHAITTSN